jgi:hypothetical protein
MSVAMETGMSLDLLTQYIDHALTLERMAVVFGETRH